MLVILDRYIDPARKFITLQQHGGKIIIFSFLHFFIQKELQNKNCLKRLQVLCLYGSLCVGGYAMVELLIQLKCLAENTHLQKMEQHNADPGSLASNCPCLFLLGTKRLRLPTVNEECLAYNFPH